jgi:hypothetical protein
LLKYGIYDEHNIVDSSEIYERTKSAYCNSSSQDWGLTIPVGDLPVTGNASFRDNACGNSSSVRYESYFLQKSARIINADIIRGFNECLRTDNAGITYVVKTTEAPERFTIDFSFVRFGDVVSDKMNVLIEGATCASAAPNKQFSGRTVDGEARQFKISTKLPMSCKRKKEDAVQITAFSLKGVVNTESITLPGWKPEKPKPTSFKFYDPLVDKLALDMCPAWASNCSPGGVNGQAAATLWCHARELGDALEVKVLLDTPSTRIITSGKVCDQPTCDRVAEVTCAAQ